MFMIVISEKLLMQHHVCQGWYKILTFALLNSQVCIFNLNIQMLQGFSFCFYVHLHMYIETYHTAWLTTSFRLISINFPKTSIFNLPMLQISWITIILKICYCTIINSSKEKIVMTLVCLIYYIFSNFLGSILYWSKFLLERDYFPGINSAKPLVP